MKPQNDLTLARRGSAGFSMIESLIAAGVLLIIALGLLPLFARAIQDNSTGNDSTQSTNNGRTRVEEMLAPPFLHQALTLAGAEEQKEAEDAWTQGDAGEAGDADEGWWKDPDPTQKGRILWNRTTRVRQYSIGALADGELGPPEDDGSAPEEALPGNAQPIFVQLKEIEVVIGNPKKGSILGGSEGITLRRVRPF